MSSSLIHNYPQLQNLIKRDPSCYHDEFLQQLTYFQNVFDLVRLAPQDPSDTFCELLQFICHVSHCYPTECSALPTNLIQILNEFSTILNPELRTCIVKCLFMLKNKRLISIQKVITSTIVLFKCQDKVLREVLYDLILNDLRNANKRSKNDQLNRAIQSLLYGIVEGKGEYEGVGGLVVRYSLRLLVDLFRKNIWNDERTANLIAKCCFLKDVKSAVIALKFFVLSSQSPDGHGKGGGDSDDSGDSDAPEETYKNLLKSAHISGNSKSKKQQIKRALDKVKRKENLKTSNVSKIPSFYAIEMLNDPQGFAERLFSLLKSTAERFKIKLLMINVLTSVIAVHKLLLLDIYQFVTRFLTPHQRDVTLLLAYAAQSCHEDVPANEIEILVRAIADNFVSDHCANEVIVVGLNSIREIVRRCPLAMTDVLLQDLAQYKSYKDKGVMMAARSLIGFFRETNPELLHKKDRGRDGNYAARHGLKLNTQKVATRIEGADLLDKWKKETEDRDSNSATDSESDGGSDISDCEDELSASDFEEDELTDCEDGCSEHEDEQVESIDERGYSLCSTESRPLETTRLLTDEEFRRIAKLQKRQELASSLSKSVTFSSSEDESENENEAVLGLVSESSISYQPKRKKASYEERLASVEEGRKGREKFGSKRGKESRGSKTNREKSKGKNFLMMIRKQSVGLKKRRSAKQKQQSLISHLKKQKRKK